MREKNLDKYLIKDDNTNKNFDPIWCSHFIKILRLYFSPNEPYK